MNRARLTSRAEADLEEIWAHVARDSIDAADKLIRRLLSTMERLAEMPGMGPRRFELRANLHSFPVGDYLIFYVPFAHDGIMVLRVLHGARDIKKVFDEDAD